MAKFKGGITICTKGYLKITAGPLRNKRVHILVAEAMLGRKLTKDETVHHRNLNQLDPSPTNLKVMGRSEHGFVSNRQRWFLENRDRKELALYQQWIEQGGLRPDLTVTAADQQDESFNVASLEQETLLVPVPEPEPPDTNQGVTP